MVVRLRGHHLNCILTYLGRGYSPGFVLNMDEIVTRLRAGAIVEIVTGPDDLCRPLLAEQAAPHCLNDSVVARDARALQALGGLLGRDLDVGDRLALDAALLSDLRSAFASGSTRAACAGCEWSSLCDAIAASGFTETKL
ncbi:DUF1284 domain-containing protein [Methylovirgula sp. 4M-Z18]|uniref:DUF1284 domain-containing protein n=1 Tax=Methylovirgula sp. 4M-Z18 TaxID=2293567 RepID=UPI000E2F8CF5|nr:DUF1284 domain-containing protein [Methylovirgula sp. 4M-Z18]RFB78406.1 DUF1284 domain-containing protein [Methylovirgula sp. 4M-Z18]